MYDMAVKPLDMRAYEWKKKNATLSRYQQKSMLRPKDYKQFVKNHMQKPDDIKE